MASPEEIEKVVTMLCVAFPHFKPHQDTFEVYGTLLEDIPGDTLKLAAMECATNGKFFPTVHELRAAAVNLSKRSNAVPSSAEAWQEMLDAPADGIVSTIRKEADGWHIDNRPYQFSHALVEKVARNMGWPHKFWTDFLVADRSRFLQAYEEQMRTSTSDALSLPVVREYVYDQMEAGKKIKQLTKGMTK